jgi:hypothetical protein
LKDGELGDGDGDVFDGGEVGFFVSFRTKKKYSQNVCTEHSIHQHMGRKVTKIRIRTGLYKFFSLLCLNLFWLSSTERVEFL